MRAKQKMALRKIMKIVMNNGGRSIKDGIDLPQRVRTYTPWEEIDDVLYKVMQLAEKGMVETIR